jgi:hypothetical protein
VLKYNIEVREPSHGRQPFLIISKLIESLAKKLNEEIK